MTYPLLMDFDDSPPLRAGTVRAKGLFWIDGTGSEAQFLADCRTSLLSRVCDAGETWLRPERKAAVRAMLRYGAYKPAGRAKPSSEYLVASALEHDFPAVNPFVDAVNLVSLEYGYPASIIDADLAGEALLLRRGRAGEQYVFNAGGQSIDLEDLLCLFRRPWAGETSVEADGWIPCANPVRDSMATKLFPGARNALAIIYAPAGIESQDLDAACARLTALLAPLAGEVS